MLAAASEVLGSEITEMLAVDARAPREVPTKWGRSWSVATARSPLQ
jgi:hypothetical protein